jgi:hypothetical protein
MSDDRIRLLERGAAAHDAEALSRLDAELTRLGRSRLPAWGSYDVEEVFKYGKESGFTEADVAETLAQQEGENDGRDWWAVVRLFNGRHAVVRAGCDYTGWG